MYQPFIWTHRRSLEMVMQPPRTGPSSLSRMAELDFEVRQRGQQAALQRGKEDKERWSTDQKKYIYEVCCGCAHIRS